MESSDSLSDQRCLQQLQMAANTSIWRALCQHAKMDMKKDYRIWLNESSYNDFITRAMDQANEGNYKDNLYGTDTSGPLDQCSKTPKVIICMKIYQKI